MATVKGKVKVKVRPKKKPIKPKFGAGSAGLLSVRIRTEVKKEKEK